MMYNCISCRNIYGLKSWIVWWAMHNKLFWVKMFPLLYKLLWSLTIITNGGLGTFHVTKSSGYALCLKLNRLCDFSILITAYKPLIIVLHNNYYQHVLNCVSWLYVCIIPIVATAISFHKSSYVVGKNSPPEPIKLVLNNSSPLNFTVQIVDREGTATSELYH